MARFFCLLPPGQAFGLIGVVVRILRRFQGMAGATLGPPTLFKNRRNVRTEKSLANSWRNVAATSLSYCRLARTAWATKASSAVSRRGRRLCPAALAKPARPPVCQRLNQVYTG